MEGQRTPAQGKPSEGAEVQVQLQPVDLEAKGSCITKVRGVFMRERLLIPEIEEKLGCTQRAPLGERKGKKYFIKFFTCAVGSKLTRPCSCLSPKKASLFIFTLELLNSHTELNRSLAWINSTSDRLLSRNKDSLLSLQGHF